MNIEQFSSSLAASEVCIPEQSPNTEICQWKHGENRIFSEVTIHPENALASLHTVYPSTHLYPDWDSAHEVARKFNATVMASEVEGGKWYLLFEEFEDACNHAFSLIEG